MLLSLDELMGDAVALKCIPRRSTAVQLDELSQLPTRR
jgi:hypothetical protein